LNPFSWCKSGRGATLPYLRIYLAGLYTFVLGIVKIYFQTQNRFQVRKGGLPPQNVNIAWPEIDLLTSGFA